MEFQIADNKVYWNVNNDYELEYAVIEELIRLKQNKYELIPKLELIYNLSEYKKYKRDIDNLLYKFYNGEKIFKFYKPNIIFINIFENIIKNILNKNFKKYENYINTIIGCDEFNYNGLDLGESSNICGCKYIPQDFMKYFYAKSTENIIYSKYPIKYLIYELL